MAAGGHLNRALTGNLPHQPCSENPVVKKNPVIPWYTAAVFTTVLLNFVGKGRCSRELDRSAEAACRAEAWFRVNQTIITHFYVIITLLLPVMTVIVALSLLLHYYYVFTRLFLHHYYLFLL